MTPEPIFEGTLIELEAWLNGQDTIDLWAWGPALVLQSVLGLDFGPWPKYCPVCVSEFHEDGTVTPAPEAS
jgi:hypothetical protein